MDEIRVRELPQKNSSIAMTDLMIIEDEDGTKAMEASAFKSLIQQSIFYPTVEDMKNATLLEGDIIRTLGNKYENDGGGAFYKIVYAPTDVEDKINILYLHTSDTLRAHLISGESVINANQAGAYGDGAHDDFTVIQKLVSRGGLVGLPKKVYKISGSVTVPSNTIIDLNGSTIYCPNAPVFIIGLDGNASNITIKNGNIMGQNGICLYSGASDINIHGCVFGGYDNAIMEKALQFNGASNVNVSNIKIGGYNNNCKMGIFFGEPSDANDTKSNYNIQISNVSAIVSSGVVSLSGITRSKGISIINVIGECTSAINSSTYGVLITANVEGLSLSDFKLDNFTYGINVTGVITASVSCNNMIATNCKSMYNLGSGTSTIYLNGIQKFIGISSDESSIFDRITSKLVLLGGFDLDTASISSGKFFNTSAVGDLIDSSNPVGSKKISIVSMNALNNNTNTSIIPPFRNVSINLEFSGNISEMSFPSLTGQTIAVYSDVAECKLIPSSKMRIPKEITLSQYEPVVLSNTGGVWKMVQFGGNADGSSGGGVNPTGLEKLYVYAGGEKLAEYDGSAERMVNLTLEKLGAAPAKHTHSANEVSGIPTIPTSLKNPNSIIIQINGGTTENIDKFTYDGSEQKVINIDLSSAIEIPSLDGYAKKYNFEGTGSFSHNRATGSSIGINSVTLGSENSATGETAVAIGQNLDASGNNAFAEGVGNISSGNASHAEGNGTISDGVASHAEGVETVSSGEGSHAEGKGTIATGSNQHVEGRYNEQDDDGNYVHIVGGGSGDSNRQNIYTLDWSGNAHYAGKVSASEPTDDSNLTTKHYVDTLNNVATTNIADNAKSIKNIVDSLGSNMNKFCTVVQDWKQVNNCGFVCGINAVNGPEGITDWLMGISIAKSAPGLDSADSLILIVFSVSSVFTSIAGGESTGDIDAFINVKMDGNWSGWQRTTVGKKA